MKWVVIRQGGEPAVGLEEDRQLECLQTHLGQAEIEFLQYPDVTQCGPDQPFGAKLDLSRALLGHLVDEGFGHRRYRPEIYTYADRNLSLLGPRYYFAHVLGLADVARVETKP